MLRVYVFKEFEHEARLRLALKDHSFILDRATTTYPDRHEEIYTNNVKILGCAPDLDAVMSYYGFQRQRLYTTITRSTGNWIRKVSRDDSIRVDLVAETITESVPIENRVYTYSPSRLPLYYATLRKICA